jgi:hypothetical protein
MVDNQGGGLPDQPAVLQAIGGLFQAHEVQVLGAMGLFIGYICVFFTKIFSFTHMYIGICGVVGTTILLLLLNKELAPKSFNWWVRFVTVIVLALFFTSPQLYFAWTVSVSEAKLASQTAQATGIAAAEQKFVAPDVTISNPSR